MSFAELSLGCIPREVFVPQAAEQMETSPGPTLRMPRSFVCAKDKGWQGMKGLQGSFTAHMTSARMEAAVIRWDGHNGHNPLDCSSSPEWDSDFGTEVRLPVAGFEYSWDLPRMMNFVATCSEFL